MSEETVILWSGGKDSALALYEAKKLGIEVSALATFVPKDQSNPFIFQHIQFLHKQAEAIGLPLITQEAEWPLTDNYADGYTNLKQNHGVETIITGDTRISQAQANHIPENALQSGVKVLSPLWEKDQQELLEELIDLGFKIIFFSINSEILDDKWLGAELTRESLQELIALSKSSGFTLNGSQEEYQTLALDGPIFQKRLQLNSYLKCQIDKLKYLDIQKVFLQNK